MLRLWLYNLALLALLILCWPIVLVWMLCVPKFRAGFGEKLGFLPPKTIQKLKQLPKENRVWIHCVSVGELNAARPLITALTQRNWHVILSNTTATGHQLALKTYPQLPSIYFPFDLPGCIRKTLDQAAPQMVIILETEIWPNFLAATSQRKMPIFLVNGRLSDRSFKRYFALRWFFGPILNQFTHLMMQSDGDKERVLALGVPVQKVTTTGNLKFETHPNTNLSDKTSEFQELLGWPPETPIIVFASTHAGEDELLIVLYEALLTDFPTLKMILAPRHPERFEAVSQLLKNAGLTFKRRSELAAIAPNPQETQALLLDSIGELTAIYGLATVACIGGSFVPWGGHNPLEPITAGIPVVFGPHMHNFKDIVEKLLAAKAGFQADSIEEAKTQITQLLTTATLYQNTVANGQQMMAQHQNVTAQILAQLAKDWPQLETPQPEPV